MEHLNSQMKVKNIIFRISPEKFIPINLNRLAIFVMIKCYFHEQPRFFQTIAAIRLDARAALSRCFYCCVRNRSGHLYPGQ